MQHSSVDVEALRRGGVIALKDNMFSVWVKTACCNLNSNQLRKLADITDRYARGFLLFSTRQIPIIPFIELKDIADVKRELGEVEMELDRCGPRVRNLNVCYEAKICPEAVVNSISLGERLEKFFSSQLMHKIKIGIAGCSQDCVVARVLSDIGFIGTQLNGFKGYDAYVGGRLGVNPFVGIKISQCLSEEACVKLVHNYFEMLASQGKAGERGADLINRLSIEKVKQELTRDLQAEAPHELIDCPTKLDKEQTDKTILRIRATCGEVNSKQLRKIAEIAERFGRGFVHFVVRGSPEVPCIDKQHVPDIEKELEAVGLRILDRGIDNLQTCYGGCCIESIMNTQSLLRNIEKRIDELGMYDLNIKISAAGCPSSCGIAHLSDIGFHGVVEPEVDVRSCNGCGLCLPLCKRKAIEIRDNIATIDNEKCRYCGQCISVCPLEAIAEKRKGYAVLVGGHEGENTRLGTVIAEFVSEESALQIAERCLNLVRARGADVAAIIDEIGIEKVKEELTLPVIQ